MARFGRPEIFNTDQGSQFTSRVLAAAGIRISMDGRGPLRWTTCSSSGYGRRSRTKDIYLKDTPTVVRLTPASLRGLRFYNATRPHQALGDRTPMAICDGCGHDASLGQRYRVADMPTAATTAAADSAVRSVISGSRSGQK